MLIISADDKLWEAKTLKNHWSVAQNEVSESSPVAKTICFYMFLRPRKPKHGSVGHSLTHIAGDHRFPYQDRQNPYSRELFGEQMVLAKVGIRHQIQRIVIFERSWLPVTVQTACVCTIWNSPPDSADGDLGEVRARVYCENKCFFCTIWNSSPDSLDGDLGGPGLAFTVKTDVFLHNLAFVSGCTRFTGFSGFRMTRV